jgi:hypothetical protein
MNVIMLTTILVLAVGCSKTQKPDDNSMTRYADSLHEDVKRAQEAADKANALNKSMEKAVSNPNEQ